MKVLHIEARRKFGDVDLSLLDDLERDSVSLVATVQYLDLIPVVKKYLEDKGKKVFVEKGTCHDGQVLGCDSSAIDSSADVVLMIADGKFHAVNNAIQIQKPIYVFNTKSLEKISQKDIDLFNKKIVVKKKKFLAAKKIGILVSTKFGQRFGGVGELKKKIEKMGKWVYVFEANDISASEFENFPQIEIWINTACFGLARDDLRIVNVCDVAEFL